MSPDPAPMPAQSRSRPISDRRYREMMSASLDLLDQGLTVFDEHLRLIACNRSFLELLDFPAALSEPGTPFEAFIRHNALRGEYGEGDPERQIAERVSAARMFVTHDTRRLRPNGRLLSIRGFPLPHRGFIAIYSDITEVEQQRTQIERHQSELESAIILRTAELHETNRELTQAIEVNRQITAALRQSEGRLRRITDNIPAHIAYVDKSWTYRYANRRYAEWFGWTTDSMPGLAIRRAIGDQVFAFVEPYVHRALEGETVSYEYTTEHHGNTVNALSTLVPDIDEHGEVHGCFVHSVDTTEQRRTQHLLAQAQKMEAIGQLAGGLAHDFNNMLTIVMGNLGGIRDARPHDPLNHEFIEPALEAASRGVELVKRLLAFSRQQPLAPRPVEVNGLIAGMTRLIRRSLPDNITLINSSRKAELFAMVDSSQLDNALLNLALNARDAMPNGGELRIETTLERLDAGSAADLELPPGEYVQIGVSDNGTGMDSGIMARVFEPFFTTKKFGLGNGLGLAMVYGFVKQSGGGVRIRSRQAVGTTIALILPCASDSPDGTGTAATAPLDLQGRLVLLVDDDAEVRKIVRMQLSSLGCSVLEAESGAEAADMLENVPAISLLLTDVVMPGDMDGRALARFARHFRPEVPAILMSGYIDRGPVEAHDPSIPLLVKPFDHEALLAALGRASSAAKRTIGSN
ncbi:PAS-domain containing protein [Thauera butanivorans]|uniref:PAS-domain containing protein n=1 Tax=Thauera butanivorans TaxID=86174 RepID=UPI003AB576BB